MTRPSQNQTKTSLPPPTPVMQPSSVAPKTFATRYPWLQTGLEPADDTSKTRSDGTVGILSGAVWDEKFERELAAAKARDREYDARHNSLERMLRSVDDVFSRSPYLKEKLLAAAAEKMSAAAERTFLKYKMFCEEWSLPFLPETAPQAI